MDGTEMKTKQGATQNTEFHYVQELTTLKQVLQVCQNTEQGGWPVPPTGYILTRMDLTSHFNFDIFRVFDPEVDPPPLTIPNFWKSVGFQIKSIHFDHCLFDGTFPYLFEKMVVDMMPNLESLKVTDCQLWGWFQQEEARLPMDPENFRNFPDNSDEEILLLQEDVQRNPNLKRIQIKGQTPMNFYQLLLIAPNLEELVLDTNLDSDAKPYNFKLLIKTLIHLRPLLIYDFCPLKRLDLMDALPYQTEDWSWRDDLVVMLPKLQELAINLVPRDKQGEARLGNGNMQMQMLLEQRITYHTGTLEVVKVFCPPIFTPVVPSIVTLFQSGLPQLRELYLWGNCMMSGLNLKILLEFEMPKLKVLWLDFRCHDQLDKMEALYFGKKGGLSKFRQFYNPVGFMETVDFPVKPEIKTEMIRKEHLERFHFDARVNSESIEVLGKWMPNLKMLELVVDSKVFEAICGGLPGLEELVLLYGSRIDDEVLTGLITDEEDKERNPKNLTALKRLKRFEMKEILCDVKSGRLGDTSVYEGFLKMYQLESVHVCVASEKITAEGEAALRQCMAKVELIKEHQENEKRECCRLRKFYGEVLQML